jgi:quinoprotein dehydrogenase-associated probable ABC transporter substrate-binding protein
MSSASSLVTLAVVALTAAAHAAPPAAPITFCADPNNRPFSSRNGDGFENRIAALVARDLGRPLAYFWAPQRRGFIRTTLAAGRCDVVAGMPSGSDRVLTTRPYYRSSYVFVTRRDRHLRLASFDDPRLTRLTIGIQLTGNDYDNPPAAHALAAHHLAGNVRGYTVYGDYSRRDPQRDVVNAVARGDVDVAVVWGPQAGYFARRATVPLDLTAVQSDPHAALVFSFDIAMGVRAGDEVLQSSIDRVLARRATDIARILAAYGVPVS